MDRSDRLTRRMFLERAAIGVLTTAAAARELDAQAVPNSSGTEPPQLKAPPRACDCHMHIYDAPRFPLAPVGRVAPTSAAVPQYRLLQKRLGTTRVIVVTPRNYATDNRATVDAIAQFAPNARGVAVVHPTVSDVELKKLHAAGIRGIRFSLGDPKTAAVTVDMIEPLAKRIAALGWHVQINWTSDDIAAADAIWKRLPTPIVFDHIGQLPASGGVAHPAYAVMRRLLDAGRAWVKLSVTYTNSRVGPPGYADVVEVGQALVKAVPERLVWGSNWPHPNEPKSPDDARLFDLMAQWAPDEAVRRRIFVDNPARLYDFAAV